MGPLAGIVVCGGESSRMGRPKAWLDFGGETLLARTVRVVASVAAPVVVVAAPEQDLPALPAGVVVVRDAVRGNGPLQGLAAGLEAIAAHAPAAFVTATDAPFLHPALVRRLAELLDDEHDIVVPRVEGRIHPLAGVYRVAVLPVIAASLAEGTRRLMSLLERARTREVDEAVLLAGDELRAVDPALRSLRNVNTPEEYAAALIDAALGGGLDGPLSIAHARGMGQPAERRRMSPEEYLAFERASEVKHEYADGEIFDMSGGTLAHSHVAANIIIELGLALRGRPCRALTSDMRIGIAPSNRFVYPDASVVCGRPELADETGDVLRNPVVVIEVLSDSSEAYDRGDKFEQYRLLTSMNEYVLASQKTPAIEVFTRQPDGSWTLRVHGPGQTARLASIDCDLSVNRVYEGVFGDESGAV